MASSTARPAGITLLAVLTAVGGILAVLVGAVFLGIGGAVSASGHTLLGGLTGAFGGVVFVVGLAALAVAYGYWALRPWAWLVGVALAVIQVVLAILELADGRLGPGAALLRIVLQAGILWYLNQPHVRRAFGRAAPAA